MTDTPETPVSVLALNPAVDISYEIPQLIADQKVRASSTRYHPGGNGINVARALIELDVPIHCCSAIGGESGDLLLRLLGDTLGKNHSYFRVPGETRLNATLLQMRPPSQYEVDSVGPEIPPPVLEEIIGCFTSSCGNGTAVLTGFVPPGVPHDIYRRLAELIKSQGGKAVIDAHGPVLEEALRAEPHLLRLNRYVLEIMTNRRLESTHAVAEEARNIQRRGIGIVCISLGADGAILVNDQTSIYCAAPRLHIRSTVGSGDALVAGLVASMRNHATMQSMLSFGVACGSATATRPGTELFTRDDIRDLSNDVVCKTLDI